MSKTPPTPVLAYALMAALLFILPMEGTAALRNLLLAGVLSAFLWYARQARPVLAFPLWRIWALYGGISLLGLCWAVDVNYSLSEIRHEILIAALVFWLAYNLFAQGGMAWMVGGILSGNVFLVAYALLVWASGGTTVDNLNGTFQTGVGNFSTYLVLVQPVLVWAVFAASQQGRGRWAAALAVWVLANLLAMYITKNRLGFASLLCEMLVVFVAMGLWRRPRLLFAGLLVGLSLFGLFVVQMADRGFGRNVTEAVAVNKALATDGRLERWRFALTESLHHPFSGGGLGRETFKHVYPDHPMTETVFVHTHNMLVNRLVQLGIPGVLAFLALFAGGTVLAWGQRRRVAAGPAQTLHLLSLAVCVGMLSKNMTDDFFMRELGYFYWVLIAGLLGLQVACRRHGWAATGQENAGAIPAAFLIIRRDNIGDLLCTTPLIHALRQRYPSARMDALVNSYNAPVLVGNPDLHHVYAYTKAKHREPGESVIGVYLRRVWLLLTLRRVAYDVVILAGDGNPARQMGLARWLNAGQVIGFAGEGNKPCPGLDIALPRPPGGHEVERTFSLLAPLGIQSLPPSLVLFANPQEQARAAAALAPVPGAVTVAVHLSARKLPQRWPVERFASVLRSLHQQRGARFMLFWAPGDATNPLHPGDDEKAQALLDSVPDVPVLPYPTHQLSQLIGGLSQCDALICADGGAMHIGAALGLPIVSLFGNSDGERWRPWGVPHVFLQEASRDVNAISVEQVVQAFLSLPQKPRST